jgi:hypothetical protein
MLTHSRSFDAFAPATQCHSASDCVIEPTPDFCGANAKPGSGGFFTGGGIGACRHRNDTLPANKTSVCTVINHLRRDMKMHSPAIGSILFTAYLLVPDYCGLSR